LYTSVFEGGGGVGAGGGGIIFGGSMLGNFVAIAGGVLEDCSFVMGAFCDGTCDIVDDAGVLMSGRVVVAFFRGVGVNATRTNALPKKSTSKRKRNSRTMRIRTAYTNTAS